MSRNPNRPTSPSNVRLRVAGFDGGLNVGRVRSALLVGHHNQLHFSGFDLRPDDRQCGQIDLDASFGEIVDGLNAVSVRNFIDIQIRTLQESGERKIERAR